MLYEVNLPSLSPTMEEGKIVKWIKKEKDPILSGEVLFEVETDKATMEYESPEDGYIAKIIFMNIILAIYPSSGDSYSIVALSVSTSNKTSPLNIGSFSFFIHLTILPSSIVGDKEGKLTSYNINLYMTLF